MKIPYQLLKRVLLTHDTSEFTNRRDMPGRFPRGLLTRLRRLRRLYPDIVTLPGRSIGEMLVLLRALRAWPCFQTFDATLEIPPGRRLIVLAHAASFQENARFLKRDRDKLFLIAPFRSAIWIAQAGIIPDVTVLVDRSPENYQYSVQAWEQCPAQARARLAESTTLLVEPFTPLDLFKEFVRVLFLDCGRNLLPQSAALPFWGYPLVTSLALPLSMGARRIAILGIDLGSNQGIPRRSWTGQTVLFDERQLPLLGLLEVMAMCEGEFIDLGTNSIRKRGYRALSIEEYLKAPAASIKARRRGAGSSWNSRGIPDHLMRHLEALLAEERGVFNEIRRKCLRGLDLLGDLSSSVRSRSFSELEKLVHEAESVWRTDKRQREAIERLRPTFLMNLWQLEEQEPIRPVNRREAVRKKAILVFHELDHLAEEYFQRPEVSLTLQENGADSLRLNDQKENNSIRRVGIIGVGLRGREAAEWLQTRYGLTPAMWFTPPGEKPGASFHTPVHSFDSPALRTCDLLLVAVEHRSDEVIRSLLERGLRAYDDFMSFHPSGKMEPPPGPANITAMIDRLGLSDLDDLAQAVRQRVVERSSLHAGYWLKVYQQYAYPLRDHAGFAPSNKAILELGTGTGLGLLILFQLSGARLTCTLDFQNLVKPHACHYRELLAHVLDSPDILVGDELPAAADVVREFKDMVRFDGERAHFNHNRLRVHRGSILHMPYAKGTFDLVCSNAVLEHVTDLVQAAREINRVLVPGGLAIHEIDLRDHSDFDNPHRFLRYSDRLWWWLNQHQAYTENRLRRSDFSKIFDTAGLEILWEFPKKTSPITEEIWKSMHPRFQTYDRQDLSVVVSRVILRKVREAS